MVRQMEGRCRGLVKEQTRRTIEQWAQIISYAKRVVDDWIAPPEPEPQPQHQRQRQRQKQQQQHHHHQKQQLKNPLHHSTFPLKSSVLYGIFIPGTWHRNGICLVAGDVCGRCIESTRIMWFVIRSQVSESLLRI
ncbi:protein dead ringer-like isoform X2 [Drosophila obscura]|uniref:protein dead ringer-like isoform X2 n=1 Tax=Drosophila obscura TaxID=7282 RepID=UPI001BB2A240|nr:protein dead ringer-like isoform X2 [Drosophila obscura]